MTWPSDATLVHLVRHGEAEGNLDPALRRSDPPLTPRGRVQAARAAAALAGAGVDAVYSTPLRRARETADAIAAAAGLTAAVVEGFAEVDMGTLTHPGSPEERAEADAIFSAWLAGDFRRAFPGGEDFAAVVRRVAGALAALPRPAPDARLVLVTHRMPIAAAAAACGSPGTPGACPNGSITTLRLARGAWVLDRWADARHLA